MSRIKSRVFWTYLISNVLNAALPIVILGSVMYYHTFANFQKEVEASNLHKLEQIRDLTDLYFNGLQHTVNQMSLDPKLMPLLLNNDSFAAIEAIRELGKYKANSVIADDALLYFLDDTVVYMSSGRISLDVLTSSIYQFESEERTRFIQDLNRIDKPQIRPASEIVLLNNERKRMITALYPLPTRGPFSKGTVVFIIEESKLVNMLSSILGDFRGSSQIVDSNGNAIAAWARGSDAGLDAMQPGFSHAGGIEHLEIGGRPYTRVSVRSDTTGWNFSTLMPSGQFLGKIIEMRTFILIVPLFILILCLVTAMGLSIRQHNPIRRLADYVANHRVSSGMSAGRTNELQQIHESIDAAFRKADRLLEQVDRQKPFVLKQCISELLNGNDPERVAKMEALHPLRGCGYYVLLLTMTRPGEPLSQDALRSKKELMEKLDTIHVHGGSGYGIELAHDRSVAVLVNVHVWTDRPKEVQQSTAASILRLAKEGHPTLKPTIAIGKLYRNLGDIHLSFIEACAAMEYRVREEEAVLFFEDIDSTTHKMESRWYPVKEQVKFMQSLKMGNEALAGESLSLLFDCIRSSGYRIAVIRCMCYDLINTTLKVVDEVKPCPAGHIEELVNFTSLDDLQKRLRLLIADVCAHVKNQSELRTASFLDQVTDYIQQEIGSPGLSLESVADRFGVSVSYLGKAMKEQIGETFTDYVTMLRLEAVKKRLVSTDLPVKEIVNGVGYISVSTFIEKFKKLEGITPGEYRTLYRNGH